MAGAAAPALMKVFRGLRGADKALTPNAAGLINFAENPAAASAFARGRGNSRFQTGAQVMPARLDVKNALDLVEMNPRDLEAIRARLPAGLQKEFDAIRTRQFSRDPNIKTEGDLNMTDLLVNRMHANAPTALADAGFDGVHYRDGVGAGANSWGVPDAQQIINYLTGERGSGNLTRPR